MFNQIGKLLMYLWRLTSVILGNGVIYIISLKNSRVEIPPNVELFLLEILTIPFMEIFYLITLYSK